MLRLGESDVLARSFILLLPLAKVRRLRGLRVDYFANLLIVLFLMCPSAGISVVGVTFVVLPGHLAESNEVNLESTTDAQLAFDVDGSAHLMNNSVADAQA